MNTMAASCGSSVVWVGVDVSADSFDACVVAPGQAGVNSPAALRRLPVESFERTERGAARFLKGLAGQAGGCPVRAGDGVDGALLEPAGWVGARGG